MILTTTVRRLAVRAFGLGALIVALAFQSSAAHAADPIRIGLSLSLTGPTAAAGKQVLAGLEIWRDDVNAKGGLLLRPVELVYYDDQGNPANAPGIYTKLMTVDKVDLAKLDRPDDGVEFVATEITRELFIIDTVALIRATNEVDFKPKLIGGAMLGLLVTGIKQQLGPIINGYISNEFYIPAPSLQFAGSKEMIAEYQKRAPSLGTDPLGYTYPPYAYAAGQILAKAVSETKSLANGEWSTPRIICTQFQNVDGNDIGQFKDWTRQVVVYPPAYKTGELVYPFANAKMAK